MQKIFKITAFGLFVLFFGGDISAENSVVINFQNASVIAKENNHILKNLRTKRLAIRKLVSERWRDYLPTVGLGFYRQKYIISGASDAISNEIRLNFEETIFDGGMRRLNLESAKLDDILFSEEAKIESNKIEFEVQKNLLNALAAKLKTEISKQALSRWEEELKITRLQFQEGFSTESQLLSILSKIQESKLQILNSENSYKNSVRDLKFSLCMDPERSVSISGNLTKDFIYRKPSNDRKSLLEFALSERPEKVRANILRVKSEKEKEYTENLWIPRFSIGGYLGKMDEDFPLRQPTWGLNVKLSFPLGNSTNNTSANTGVRPNSLAGTGIRNDNSNFNSSGQSNMQFFDNLSYSRKLMESKLKVSDAKTQQRLTEDGIHTQILKSSDEIQTKWDAIRFQTGKFYVKYLNRELVKKRFHLGELKNIDLMSSENELAESEYGLANSIAEYGIAILELKAFLPDHSGLVPYFEFKPGSADIIGNIVRTITKESEFTETEFPEPQKNPLPGKENLPPNEFFEKTKGEETK